MEIGCGAGAVSCSLARLPGIGAVVGVDTSPTFIVRTGEFRQGDGERLPLPDARFDVAILHTVLSHVPEPPRVPVEAFRVLRSGGAIGIFDGDCNTMTVAGSDIDPLQSCAVAFVRTAGLRSRDCTATPPRRPPNPPICQA